MVDDGKKRYKLRSGRAVLGDISNQHGVNPVGGVGKKLQQAPPEKPHVVTRHLPARADENKPPNQGAGKLAVVAVAASKSECSRGRNRRKVEEEQDQEEDDEGYDLECREEDSEDEDSEVHGDLLSSEDEEEEEEEEIVEERIDEEISVVNVGSKRRARRSSTSSSPARDAKRVRRTANTRQSRRSAPLLLPRLRPPHPVDRKDLQDPAAVVDYADDIHDYMREQEVKVWPRKYMTAQKEINSKMRAILVDWLVEVHQKFKLVPQSLYLCIHLIDRYCMANSIARNKLQLVGVTCLLIASKYEEIYPPEVRDCVYITDNAYDREEVLEMEQKLLKFFNFHITMPTVHHFLVRYAKVAQGSHLCIHRATYFAERALQEHEVLQWKPSHIAAAAVYLAKRNETLDAWTPALVEYTGYTEDDLTSCAVLMSKWVQEVTQTQSRRLLNAVKKKFASVKFMEISELDHQRIYS